jgi:tRNA U34 5-methylaminomethyl-2-thiouridine-forming methyltransferase MnmC
LFHVVLYFYYRQGSSIIEAENQIELRLTNDGSHTIYVPVLDETYHSVHGAFLESHHVYIKNGFLPVHAVRSHFDILEVGFGTGLNICLSAVYNSRHRKVRCVTLETNPLSQDILSSLNYRNRLDDPSLFSKIHEGDWRTWLTVAPEFELFKIDQRLQDTRFKDAFDLVYFDAFAPLKQAEMWTRDVFLNLYRAMRKDAVLVTYCASGQVKRNLKESKFDVEIRPGPPGKREMVVAHKRR